ncbi:hypothetical protein GQ600_21305 [Phytophthora cactorum]|nr:hypothetical protein GQ600_21305 [Phytophthora cactorum]
MHSIALSCFRLHPRTTLLLLPRSLEDVTSYRVVMVGDFTEGQVRKVRKMHRIRNDVVQQQNIRGQSDSWRAICENGEESIIERRVGLTDDNSPVLTREDLLLLKLGELNRRIEYF